MDPPLRTMKTIAGEEMVVDTQARGGCSSFVNKSLLADVYGRPFLFMLPNHQQKYKSIVGSVCTIFAISVVLTYAIYKYELLVDKDETRT